MVSEYTLICVCSLLLSLTAWGQGRVITLDEAYERALATDQTISIAYAEAAKARLETKLALTRLTPRVSSGLSTNSSGLLSNRTLGSSTDRDSRSASLTLRQPILDFSVGPAYRAGKISEQRSLREYEGTVRDILLAVASAYYEVLTNQKLVEINRESLRLAREQKSLAEARKNVGEVLETDVLRSEVTAQRAQRTLVESENRLAYSKGILANILNLGIEAKYEVKEPSGYRYDEETLTSAVMRALRQREDLQSAQLLIQRNRADRDEIKAQYLPSLSADAGLSRNYSNGSGSGVSESDWQFGLSMSIPWFTGGDREIQLKRSQLDIAQASLAAENVAKAVAENVQEAWLQVRTLKQNLAGLKVEVAAAEENYRLLESQYRAGEVKSLDVVQALTDLNTSRTDLTVQTYQYQLALRDLARRTAAFENERVQRALQRTPNSLPNLQLPPTP
jgi:outer membrane protein